MVCAGIIVIDTPTNKIHSAATTCHTGVDAEIIIIKIIAAIVISVNPRRVKTRAPTLSKLDPTTGDMTMFKKLAGSIKSPATMAV